MKTHLEEMKQELALGKAQLLDVRELNEWNEGHLVLAKLTPLSQLEEGETFEDLKRETKTYLHCRSGSRVHVAFPVLRDLGFNDLIPLNEGFDDLVSEGFEHHG